MHNFSNISRISAVTQINGTLAPALFPLDMDLTDYLSVHHFSRQSYCRFMRRYYSGARVSIIWYIYLCLTPGWIFTVRPALLFARVSNSIAWTWGGCRGERDDGKEKKISLNWLGEVIEERLPQCTQKSLIFLCSLVWQLNKLEMTLSISQARIGDTYKLTIADTRGFRSQMHTHARPSFALRNYSNAIFDNGNPPSGSAPERREKPRFAFDSSFFCLFN